MRSGAERRGGEECGDALVSEMFAGNGFGADKFEAEGAQKGAAPAEVAAEASEIERGTVERISEDAQDSGVEASLLPAEELGAEA